MKAPIALTLLTGLALASPFSSPDAGAGQNTATASSNGARPSGGVSPAGASPEGNFGGPRGGYGGHPRYGGSPYGTSSGSGFARPTAGGDYGSHSGAAGEHPTGRPSGSSEFGGPRPTADVAASARDQTSTQTA